MPPKKADINKFCDNETIPHDNTDTAHEMILDAIAKFKEFNDIKTEYMKGIYYLLVENEKFTISITRTQRIIRIYGQTHQFTTYGDLKILFRFLLGKLHN